MNARAVVAEFVGTALLLAAVVGSGIMAERLFGPTGLALLAKTLATGAALAAIIVAFGPVSGAHLNPAVTLAAWWQRGVEAILVLPYVAAQIAGAMAGTAVAHLMFGLPIVSVARHVRAGTPLVLGEFVATFGLVAVIWGGLRGRSALAPFAIGAYIVGAYWFTSSTSFANPAVTIARSLSDTFAGIRPADAPAFIAAQLAGAFAGTALFAWLAPARTRAADDVVVPHAREVR